MKIQKPKLLDQLTDAIRLRHYSIRIDLTSLAVKGKITAAVQDQVLNAIV